MIGRNKPCPCGSGKKYKVCCLNAGPKLVGMKQIPRIPGPAIIMLIPTRGTPTAETLMSTHHTDGIKTMLMVAPRLGVVEARNRLVKSAVKAVEGAPFIPEGGWYVLHVDDDAWWRPGTIARMMRLIQSPNIDILAGWFCARSVDAAPKALYLDGTWPTPGKDFEYGDVVEVARIGFHFVLHKLELIKDLPEDPFDCIEGEDFAFCDRAREVGKRIWVDTGSAIAHIDEHGNAYIPASGLHRVENNQLVKVMEQRDYGFEAPSGWSKA